MLHLFKRHQLVPDSNVEHVPQHLKRYTPGPAVASAERRGALVDSNDHTCKGTAVAILERDGI